MPEETKYLFVERNRISDLILSFRPLKDSQMQILRNLQSFQNLALDESLKYAY